jgi:hypothetical protein
VVQDIARDLQQTAVQPELDLLSTQTHSSMSGEYSPMSMVFSSTHPSLLDQTPVKTHPCETLHPLGA